MFVMQVALLDGRLTCTCVFVQALSLLQGDSQHCLVGIAKDSHVCESVDLRSATDKPILVLVHDNDI